MGRSASALVQYRGVLVAADPVAMLLARRDLVARAYAAAPRTLPLPSVVEVLAAMARCWGLTMDAGEVLDHCRALGLPLDDDEDTAPNRRA